MTASLVDFLAAPYLHDVVYTHRPHSPVTHLYTGTLTTSRCHTSRGQRAVCGTPSRRLTVIQETPLLLDLGSRRRACKKCSAWLAAMSQAEPLNRDRTRQLFHDISLWTLTMWCWAATTPTEAHRAGAIGAVVHGSRAVTRDPVTAPTGRVTGTLAAHVDKAVTRLDASVRAARAAASEAEAAADVARALAGLEADKVRRREAYEDRQEAIARQGLAHVAPRPRRTT